VTRPEALNGDAGTGTYSGSAHVTLADPGRDAAGQCEWWCRAGWPLNQRTGRALSRRGEHDDATGIYLGDFGLVGQAGVRGQRLQLP
jgi:hypothetical protein